MRQFRFRALVTFGAIRRAAPAGRSSGGLFTLMAHTSQPGQAGGGALFPTLITRDDGQALQPGVRTVVTITLICQEAEAPLGAGQRFAIWGDGHVGNGIISRQVFTGSGPS